MKHVKLNNGHQLAILNLIDLEVFRGIHVYFMNITGMLVTLSQTSQFFIVIVQLYQTICLALPILKTSHFIFYQLIVWLFGMVYQISLSGIVNLGHTTLRQLGHCKILHHVPVTCALSTIIYLGAGAML